MATIAELTEDFDAGTPAALVTTGGSIFDAITGLSTTPIYKTGGYDGTAQCADWTGDAGGTAQTCTANHTSTASAWYGFAFRPISTPSGNLQIMQAYGGSTIACSVRFKPDGTLDVRDGTIARSSTPALTIGEWYWISVRTQPSNATGLDFKVYDKDGAAFHAATGLAHTNSTATALDNLRFGLLAASGGSPQFDIDKVRGDTTTEIPPATVTPPATAYTHFRHNGTAWVPQEVTLL